jgi:uncharacterized Tic20 family protein
VAFILLFVVGTFCVPLAIEIYQRGSDNIVARSGREIMDSRLILGLFSFVNRSLGTAASSATAFGKSLGDFAKGVISIIGFFIAAVVALWIGWKLLVFIVWLILFPFRRNDPPTKSETKQPPQSDTKVERKK